MSVPIGEGFRGPDGRVGLLLRQAFQALRTAMQEPLAGLGITTPQYSVLSVADAQPGLSGAELARNSMLTAQSTNEIVVLLERGGLLERRPDRRDGRLRRIYVTDPGRVLLAHARPAVHAVEDRMTAHLSSEQLQQLRTWLVLCARNLAPADEPEGNT
jgi:DNA-binding MarR family transcriptional regulator